MRTIAAPFNYMTFHYANAFESPDGGEIYVDTTAFKDPTMVNLLKLDNMRNLKQPVNRGPFSCVPAFQAWLREGVSQPVSERSLHSAEHAQCLALLIWECTAFRFRKHHLCRKESGAGVTTIGCSQQLTLSSNAVKVEGLKEKRGGLQEDHDTLGWAAAINQDVGARGAVPLHRTDENQPKLQGIIFASVHQNSHCNKVEFAKNISSS